MELQVLKNGEWRRIRRAEADKPDDQYRYLVEQRHGWLKNTTMFDGCLMRIGRSLSSWSNNPFEEWDPITKTYKPYVMPDKLRIIEEAA